MKREEKTCLLFALATMFCTVAALDLAEGVKSTPSAGLARRLMAVTRDQGAARLRARRLEETATSLKGKDA